MESSIPQNDKERVLKFFEVFSTENMDRMLNLLRSDYSEQFLKGFGLYSKYKIYLVGPFSFHKKELVLLQKEFDKHLEDFAITAVFGRKNDDTIEEKEIEKKEDILLDSYVELARMAKKFLDDSTQTQEQASKNETRLIHKDNDGNYIFAGKRIKFGEAIYKDIFDILYINGDQNGFVSYRNIDKELLKRGQVETDGEEKSVKRIRNV